jgi:hypothetical protein
MPVRRFPHDTEAVNSSPPPWAREPDAGYECRSHLCYPGSTVIQQNNSGFPVSEKIDEHFAESTVCCPVYVPQNPRGSFVPLLQTPEGKNRCLWRQRSVGASPPTVRLSCNVGFWHFM